MNDIDQPVPTTTRAQSSRLTRSSLGWAMLECGRFPYLQLITGIVFVPYFASVVVGNPVEGQAEIATLGKIAGFAAAVTAPFLGASIDKIGRRKPWLAGGTFIMVVLLSLLWFAQPGDVGLPIWTVLAILIIVKILYAYTELLHNSMLIRAADGTSISHLSATSFGLGFVSSIVTLLGFLWAFALPGQYDFSWLPDRPLFGLDPGTYENVRIAGPIAGAILAVMILPLLIFTRDHERSSVGLLGALRIGFGYVRRMPSHVRGHPNAGLFIFARMIYADGIAAMNMFIGILAAGVMGWGVVELLIFGIIQLHFGVAGSFAAAALEKRLESKRSVQLGLMLAVVALTGLVGTGPDQIFVLWKDDPALLKPIWDLPLFNTVPQIVFLLLASTAYLCIPIVASGSRALLTKITPAEETGAFFGLYSLASTATAWLAPVLIGYFTISTGSQQWGFAPVVLFFVVGLVILSFVKQERA